MADRRIRCAVYTRKSTEDGLEQEFNSLDAQREACVAYISSQRHEGWALVPDHYDDGGFSGGTMERPGLVRLLAAVAAGKVDVIVIYKVDRLTRSLADFAKIVDVLDAAKASFVSITQSFNTTTSMGRLTLNMLLSFAQFEREVTGERIRDKIAASKRKGMWMGGPVPLGYEVCDRKLVVNEPEADAVRHIMRRYCALPSVNELVEDLERDGYLTKRQERASGPHRGSVPFRRGTLYHLLSNRIYLGEIVHKGVGHPGEHEAVVSQQLWDRVQAKLAERSAGGARTRAKQPSLLTGMLVDGEGRTMTPSHASKGRRRYRYYVTRPDQLRSEAEPAWRVPAHDLEAIVAQRLAELLKDRVRLHDLATSCGGGASDVKALIAAGAATVVALESEATKERRALLETLRPGIKLSRAHVEMVIAPSALLVALGSKLEADGQAEPILLRSAAVRVRHGHELRLVVPGPCDAEAYAPTRDEKLVALLTEAHAARAMVLATPTIPLSRIASEQGRCRTRLGRLIALTCLAPDIVSAILEGRQPAALNHHRLLNADLPLAWDDQRALLGFA